MPIVARCDCGNRIGLADVMAGRTIRCPKCGIEVVVPAPSATAAAAVNAARTKADASPAISISPTIVISAVVGTVLLVVVAVLYFGPWTVGNQWAAMSSKANDQVTDVVLFAIQAYESEHGQYDAALSHMGPQLQGSAVFVPPMMAFTLPRRIVFSGKTSQGNYMGTYDTTNGEIAANIETGGYTVGGLVDVRKATATFQMTGREKDGKVEAEADGAPLKIIVPKVPPRGG